MSVPRICRVIDCNRKVRCKELCDTHYERLRKGLNVEDHKISSRSPAPENCIVEGCPKPPRSRGLCTTHRAREIKGTDIDAPLFTSTTGCIVSGCERKHKANGLCKAHHMTQLNYQLTNEEIALREVSACHLCGGVNAKSGRPLHVDHDHECCPTGKSCRECIRGFLCSTCNTGLGMFKDSPELLRKAAAYLIDPPGVPST